MFWNFILILLAAGLGSVAVYYFTKIMLNWLESHWDKYSSTFTKASQKIWSRLDDGPKLTNLLTRARLGTRWSVRRFWWFRIAGIVLVLWWWAGGYGSWLLGLLFLIFAWSWPILYLRRLVVLRQKQLRQGLGYIIDLLRMQVNAGLNLETSFRGLARQSSGVWEPELRQLMLGLDHGLPLTQAMVNMAERLQIDDVQRLVAALKQAQLLGVSLSETLTIQAETLRTRRRQRAEEQARLASVKIALPLVFLIFPALLIIYIAPAVLRIMQLR